MIDYINFIVVGIVNGGLYSLLALGLTLIFGVMRFINVAHGEMLTLGAYASIMWGLFVSTSPLGTLPAALVFVLLAGLVVAIVILSPISREGRFNAQQALVLTLGLSLFLSNGVQAVFGADYQQVPGLFATWALHIGDLTLEGQRLIILLGSAIISTVLMVFLRYTLPGLAIRATAQNPEAALASGIDIRRTQRLTFALGSALAGAAGALIAPIVYAFPAMGFPFTIKAFIVVIMGGLGSIWGALLAGYILGVTESLAVIWMPTGYDAMVGPLMMLLILILRPSGILGRMAERA